MGILIKLAASLSVSIMIMIANSAYSQTTANQDFERIQECRQEFQRRLRAWDQYIDENGIHMSSFAEDYMSNQPYRRLLEMGPVAVPFFLEERDNSFLRTAFEIILRSHWPELAGYTRDQELKENMKTVLRRWWPYAPQAVSGMFEVRRNNLEAKQRRYSHPASFAQISATDEWEKLNNIGILGIPSVMKRIRSGDANELDYRLLTYWTAPLEFTQSGFPIMHPTETETIPEEKAQPDYWLRWWQANEWQFWWIPAKLRR